MDRWVAGLFILVLLLLGIIAFIYSQNNIVVGNTCGFVYTVTITNGTTNARNCFTNQIDFSGSVANVVINSALSQNTTYFPLTVSIIGNYTVTGNISINSNTYVNMAGARFLLGVNQSGEIKIVGAHDSKIFGGFWNGNSGNIQISATTHKNDGVFLYNTSRILIQSMNITNTGQIGIFVGRSLNDRILYNTVSNVGVATGLRSPAIQINGQTTGIGNKPAVGDQVFGNIVSNFTSVGISLLQSIGALVQQNTLNNTLQSYSGGAATGHGDNCIAGSGMNFSVVQFNICYGFAFGQPTVKAASTFACMTAGFICTGDIMSNNNFIHSNQGFSFEGQGNYNMTVSSNNCGQLTSSCFAWSSSATGRGVGVNIKIVNIGGTTSSLTTKPFCLAENGAPNAILALPANCKAAATSIPVANTNYTVSDFNQFITSKGGVSVSISIYTNNTLVASGLTTLSYQYIPDGALINFGGFTAGNWPNVTTSFVS